MSALSETFRLPLRRVLVRLCCVFRAVLCIFTGVQCTEGTAARAVSIPSFYKRRHAYPVDDGGDHPFALLLWVAFLKQILVSIPGFPPGTTFAWVWIVGNEKFVRESWSVLMGGTPRLFPAAVAARSAPI